MRGGRVRSRKSGCRVRNHYRNSNKHVIQCSRRPATGPPKYVLTVVRCCKEISQWVFCCSVVLPDRQFDPTPGGPKPRATARYIQEAKRVPVQYYKVRSMTARHHTRCARLSTVVIVARSGNTNATTRHFTRSDRESSTPRPNSSATR